MGRLSAAEPNDLERLFVARVNARDLDGVLALYEDDAVLVSDDGDTVRGRTQLQAFFERFFAGTPPLAASVQAPAVVSGDLALTSSRLADGTVTAEVARRQPDGSWRWVLDHFCLAPGRRG